jgi:hypothetical protein
VAISWYPYPMSKYTTFPAHPYLKTKRLARFWLSKKLMKGKTKRMIGKKTGEERKRASGGLQAAELRLQSYQNTRW